MQRCAELAEHNITNADSIPNLSSENNFFDPFYDTKVEDWLFKHFQTMKQIKEYSEIQKKCEEESYSDFMSIYDEDFPQKKPKTSSDKKVIRWLKDNFTMMKEIEKHNLKQHQRRSTTNLVMELIDCIHISNFKEFQTDCEESSEESDGNAYDGSVEDNNKSEKVRSDSDVNSTILRMVDDLDRLGSASKHGNGVNVSPDYSVLRYVCKGQHITGLPESSSDTSDLDNIFFENDENYSKWQRNVEDFIVSESKSTAL